MTPRRSHHLIGLVRGLVILSVATHLLGQALGDEPSAKTLAFVGGEAVEAYVAWRHSGHEPPRTDPYDVPAEVGRLIHAQARRGLVRSVRLAGAIGKLQGRRVPVTAFVGSPAHCWSHWFEFPPRPREIGGCPIPDVLDVSLELLLERFAPVFDACREAGTTFDLECHPGERAMGDLESAGDYIRFLERAGYGSDVVGFNLDPSHMVWQGVSPIEFIPAYAPWIHAAHIKGVQVASPPTRAGALAALAAVRAADLPPSSGRHDDALHAVRRKEPVAVS